MILKLHAVLSNSNDDDSENEIPLNESRLLFQRVIMEGI